MGNNELVLKASYLCWLSVQICLNLFYHGNDTYAGTNAQLNRQSGLFCYASCIKCGVLCVLGSMFVCIYVCFVGMQ